MPKGYLAVVLHAHLPYVRHPEHEYFLEELWFYEALAETYIPLLRMLSRLEDDGVGYNLLLSLSPTLTSMMEDELLQSRFVAHLGKTIRLADREAAGRPASTPRGRLARYYGDFYRDTLYWFEEKCGRRLAGAFGKLAAYGHLDLMTCGATHGFFPILQQNSGAVRAQIMTARDHHEAVFGRRPEGIWLPECAYYQGVEEHLAEAGFAYSFVETHGIENADQAPVNGVYAPICSPEGIAFFGRDKETGFQVWSAEQGYPGHPDYREFYRDLGYELPPDELEEFMVAGSIRVNTGLKYNRITSRQAGEKDFYSPDAAREQAARHARHFVENRMRQIERLVPAVSGRAPLVVAPYDAELFGHWWFEGPLFLDYVLRMMHYDQDTVKTLTPANYLRMYPENQTARPSGSSWGGDGTYEFWVNATNRDIIPGLHQAADRLSAIVDFRRGRQVGGVGSGDDNNGRDERIVRQMFRELLLAQASDWPFIMRTGTSPDYARKRINEHLGRFWTLDEMLSGGRHDETLLDAICVVDAIFPDCSPDWYASI